MKVVEIINTLQRRDGAEVFFSQLCSSLKKSENIELYVVSLYGNVHESFKTDFAKAGIELITLNKKSKIDLSCAKKLRFFLNEVQPDIINSHLSVLLTYFLAFGFKKKHWQLVHTFHSVADKEANLLTRVLRKPYVKKGLMSFIAISDSVAKSIATLYPTSKVQIIYNGLSIPEKLSSFDGVKKEYDFICVARFLEVKNHKMLFSVFNDYWKKHPDSKLLCLGDGVQLEKDLNYLSTLECRGNVSVPGAVRDVWPYLAKSKVFVLSSFYEGNPISILEAMASGLTIVAPSVGGIPDVVSVPENGYLFPASDEGEMLKCMIEGIASASSSERQTFNREKARKYDICLVGEKYCRAFEKCLSK